MNHTLILDIAKSLLLARWKQTLVAAIGVTFSITMFITLLSFMTGLNNLLDGLILNRTPHIRLFNDIKPSSDQPVSKAALYKDHYHFIRSVKSGNSRQEIYNSGAVMQSLQHDTRITGIAPQLMAQVFFNDGTIDITGVINGIDVEAESKLFHFNDYITEGNGLDIKNVANSIVLGKGLAAKLLANPGDIVQITTAKPTYTLNLRILIRHLHWQRNMHSDTIAMQKIFKPPIRNLKQEVLYEHSSRMPLVLRY